MFRTFVPLVAVLLVGCAGVRTAAIEPESDVASFRQPAYSPRELPMDFHSRSEPNRVRVTHLDLDLTLDFDARELRGAAELSFERFDRDAPLKLDTQGLAIVDVVGPDGRPRAWSLSADDPILGAALTIQLAPDDAKVRIAYHTTERAAALQWLSPEQTADRKQPFLFTQGQSILTRTWIPLQDSPGVRATYSAAVRAPKELTVVMSAEHLGRGDDGVWRFRMPQAIPPYLIALAAGDIAFEPISDRCGVWAEPSKVVGARDELGDTEKMIQAAEKLFGPYRWGRYDIIVLPPSFPFGGMENPRLTFATPTILAGDKSLVALVAHELAHSWSGNLVTNATWRDFWLNEGFTVFCEQRIMEVVFGDARSNLEKSLARHELDLEMKDLEPWQQVLHIDLAGKNPDDGFSGVPYEKGALFLRRLEAEWGRAAFDEFLTGYFDHHAFQSITTDDFLAWLRSQLFARDPSRADAVDLVEWLEKAGLPADAPRYESPALGDVDRERERWLRGTPARSLATERWVTQQWQHFIHTIPDDVSIDRLVELDEAFGFTRSHNCEILCDWLVLATRRRYLAADERLAEFLTEVGRRKFLKPLYTELAKTPEGLARARSIYATARPRYHAVSTGTIDKLLGWTP
ncbi:MAG: M1 family metallopeptidase [Planctomycetes bacterium]|nr:M1 family metallopeptidase [Planctomycetota bacterium]